MHRTHALLTALVAVGAASGCSNSPSGPGGTFGSTLNITVGNDFYAPSTDSVASGGTVTWTWAQPSDGHTVNWDSGPTALPPNSGVAKTSGTYVAVLTVIGTYHYHCAVHGAAMSGVIIVH